ncbi:MAG: hypothetical protein PHQ91_07340 [Thermoanaerobaculaceae bacterium]|nr:hypothetical protein [Thermoanaerobaculaceae bacterium]
MAKLDANLDACQLSSDLLLRLRKIVRESLRSTHGSNWEETGIPGELREFLTQRQAREASINWNLSDSVDALDFAGFVNLYDIIAAAPHLLQRFLPLAPDAHMLRIRFLELDTILNRIAYARPISESDLGFLVSFEERLKRTTSAPPPAVATDDAPRAPRERVERVERAEPAERAEAAAPPRAPAAAPKPTAGAAPPEPAAEPAPAPEPSPAPGPAAAVPTAAPTLGPKEIEAALKRGDSAVILTAIYQEVTSLADGLWNGSVVSMQTRTWESVRESPWYRNQFVKLGLKPISDFFGLFEAAKEKMQAGTSRNELQEFLKEHSFVQVLLALKELFRHHVRR